MSQFSHAVYSDLTPVLYMKDHTKIIILRVYICTIKSVVKSPPKATSLKNVCLGHVVFCHVAS